MLRYCSQQSLQMLRWIEYPGWRDNRGTAVFIILIMLRSLFTLFAPLPPSLSFPTFPTGSNAKVNTFLGERVVALRMLADVEDGQHM